MFRFPMLSSASTRELITAQMRGRLPWWIRNQLSISDRGRQDAHGTEAPSVPEQASLPEPASNLKSVPESEPGVPTPTPTSAGTINLSSTMTERVEKGIFIPLPGPVGLPQTLQPAPVNEAPAQPEVEALQLSSDEPEAADRSESQPPPAKPTKRQRSRESLKQEFAPAPKRARRNKSLRPSPSSVSKKDSEPDPAQAETNDESESSKSGNDDDDVDFEVDFIIDVRGSGRKKEFLVKWKGFGWEEATWEPQANLYDCPEALSEFNEKRKVKRSR